MPWKIKGASKHAYALVTKDEHEMIAAIAKEQGLSMSNFVRRCISYYLYYLHKTRGTAEPLLTLTERLPMEPEYEAWIRGEGHNP